MVTPAPATWDDQSRGIRRDGVEQLDLHADDWLQANVLGRGRKSDGAVQALVVGQRQRAHAQLACALGQVLDRRCPVQEREIRVAVELGEGTGHAAIIEQMF
jgi:hypothetical protein